VNEVGGEFLWTPPYTPTLQPIEEFWGGGKNYAAARYKNGRTMKEAVAQLRAGWYGDGAEKKPLPCDRLVAHAVADANRRMGEVGGLTGTMELGVNVLPGAVIFGADGVAKPLPNDMAHPHVEAEDLTRDSDENAAQDAAPPPLELNEDDHLAAISDAQAEGSTVAVDPQVELEAQRPAPPDSPAAAAGRRRPSRGLKRRDWGAAEKQYDDL